MRLGERKKELQITGDSEFVIGTIYEGEGFCINVVPMTRVEKDRLATEHTNRFGRRNDEEYLIAYYLKIIKSWSGIENTKGEPLPLVRESILWLMQEHPQLLIIIGASADESFILKEEKEEAEIKNLKSGTTGS